MSAHDVAPPPLTIAPSRRLAKRMALAVDGVVPSSVGSVILAYHRVGARTASPVDMPTSLFRRQLAHLAASAAVDSLDTVLLSLRDADAHGRVNAALTFDDGTSDFAEIVLPMLVEFAVPATLYLATSFVDSGEHHPADGRPLSWNALRDVVSTGLVTIGAHTHNHVLLDRVDRATAQYELDTSNGRIGDELGIAPRHFAYPKAVRPSPEIEREVIARYESAALAGTRANTRVSFDPHRLARSPIQNADGWEGFVRKLEGGMRAEDDLRRLFNLVRYRGITR